MGGCIGKQDTMDQANLVAVLKGEPAPGEVEELARVAAALKRFAVFDDLTPVQLGKLAMLVDCVKVQSNTILGKEGHVGDRMYMLAEGSAVVCGKDRHQLETELRMLGPGAVFSEVTLVADDYTHRTTTATMEPCTLYTLQRDQMPALKRELPQVHARLERRAKEREQTVSTVERISIFSSLSAFKQHALVEMCSMRRARKGEMVLERGGSGPRKFFIITSGALDVWVGRNKVRTMGPGDFFGEVSLLSEDKPHSATVVVTEDGDARLLECSRKDFRHFVAGEPIVMAEISLRVLGRDTELTSILAHPLGRKHLARYAEKEFAKENIQFWVDVENLEIIDRIRIRKSVLKALGKDSEKVAKRKAVLLKAQAEEIYSTYLRDDARSQINIADTVRQAIIKRIEARDFSFDMFNEAKREVQGLLATDTFSRFRESPEFTQLLKGVGAYIKPTTPEDGSP